MPKNTSQAPNKYTAVKVVGFNHWFWFETSKVSREDGKFVGKDGWGQRGAYTNLTVNEDHIEGEISSEALQYDE